MYIFRNNQVLESKKFEEEDDIKHVTLGVIPVPKTKKQLAGNGAKKKRYQLIQLRNKRYTFQRIYGPARKTPERMKSAATAGDLIRRELNNGGRVFNGVIEVF